MLRAKWIVLGTALVLIAAGLLTGGKAGAGHVELVWATGGMDARPGGPAEAVAAAWNQLHPNGPTVRIAAMPNSGDDQHEEMALELEAGSSEFDVLDLDLVWTAEFASKHWLEDLEGIRGLITDVSLSGPVESATWSGKLWAAPHTTDAAFLYYREDLVPSPPKTWPELVEVGLKLGKEKGIAPFVGQGARYEGMVVNFLEYFWAAGGTLFDSEGTHARFEEAPALQALEFMRTAQEKQFFAPGSSTVPAFNAMKEEEARATFQAGKAVFMRNWAYAYKLVNGEDPRHPSEVEHNVGIMPLPRFPGGKAASGLGGHNLGVSRFSRNPQAAKEFVLFVSTTPDIQRMLAREHSLAPTMASLYKEPSKDPVMRGLREVLLDSRPRPATPDWSEFSNQIQEHVYKAYNGPEDPHEAVEAIRTFLESKTGARP